MSCRTSDSGTVASHSESTAQAGPACGSVLAQAAASTAASTARCTRTWSGCPYIP